MTARAVKLQAPDVRRENLLVALASQLLADEVLQLLTNHRAFGRPQNQSRTNRVIDMKQLQFAPELAVVALARFLLHDAPVFEFLRLCESYAVNTLQLRILLVALVIGTRHRRQCERADFSCRSHMRSSAQIREGAVAVKRDLLAVGNALEDVELEAARHTALTQRRQLASAPQLHRFGARHHAAFEFLIFHDDFCHLGLDLRKILRRDAVRQIHIVIKTLLDRRTGCKLSFGPNTQNRLGEHMSAGMAQSFEIRHRPDSVASSANITGISFSMR